jgi:hypothetical protein
MTDLGLVAPPPGQRQLHRRVGEFHAFAADLIRDVERGGGNEPALAHLWDLAGDPRATTLTRLWAFVAEGVAAYAELTAAESYIGTASDWSDLRRIAGLVGYKPRPRIAAQGWVRADVDKGAAPVVPAGTRVQAPAPPGGTAQTFEVAEDTPLRGEWSGLTATWKYDEQPTPSGATIRFAGDPGFRAGHDVLFLGRDNPKLPLALATVAERKDDLGASLVTFDRDLTEALHGLSNPARAYRVLASAGTARRLDEVLEVRSGKLKPLKVTYAAANAPLTKLRIVVDALLKQVSIGSRLALVSWGPDVAAYALRKASGHAPTHWHVAPGTTVRVSLIEWKDPLTNPLLGAGAVTLYVLGPPVDVLNLVDPPQGRTDGLVRLFPGPAQVPDRLAIHTSAAWEVFTCSDAVDDGEALVVKLDANPVGAVERAPATGNLLGVRHGKSASAVLGSADGAAPDQGFAIADAPVAHDLDEAGTPVSSLAVRVDGVRWDEVQSLYGQGSAQVFSTRLGADGGETVVFGDGGEGARPSTGTNNVTATYRVGGGTAGEVGADAITSLLGQVRGVKKVSGGPTSGGADQDDERRLRTLAPARARAFGRVVSREDAVDLALGYPGVTHAAAWDGAGSTDCGCGGAGVHLAFLRAGAGGPKVPVDAEVDALAKYLAARRDATFPLCVCAGKLTPFALDVTLALDPARVPSTVLAAATAALADAAGPLGPEARKLGQPFDPSDVYPVLHAVPGVVGVASLVIGGAAADTLDRLPADRDELLVLDVGLVGAAT